MIRKLLIKISLLVFINMFLVQSVVAFAQSVPVTTGKRLAIDTSTVPIYRVYNPNSGEHHYTQNAGERNALINYGWTDEGIAWTAVRKSYTPVYRVYNPNSGEHHYTKNQKESFNLVKEGWSYEGTAWYATDVMTINAIHRVYNPNNGKHHYTKSEHEATTLCNLGWNYEGIGWYTLW